LDGIISFLTQVCGGNVHDQGIVEISVSGAAAGVDEVPRALLELKENSMFTTPPERGHWMLWDFGDLRVVPTHYTIRGCWLDSWHVESSPDGTTWTLIDTQSDQCRFRSAQIVSMSYSMSPLVPQVECRWIRVTDMGQYFGCWCAVEFFGTVLTWS
jgi:hypothetical protein